MDIDVDEGTDRRESKFSELEDLKFSTTSLPHSSFLSLSTVLQTSFDLGSDHLLLSSELSSSLSRGWLCPSSFVSTPPSTQTFTPPPVPGRTSKTQESLHLPLRQTATGTRYPRLDHPVFRIPPLSSTVT